MIEKLKDSQAVKKAKRALTKDIQDANSKYGIVIEATGMAIRGGGSFYSITDAKTGKSLGTVELSRSDYNPGEEWIYKLGELATKMRDLMKASKDELATLIQAQQTFREDQLQVETQTGINFYIPNAIPIEKRTKKTQKWLQQLVYVNTEEGHEKNGKEFYTSSKELGDGVSWVGVTAPTPGIHSYPESARYSKGDFIDAFLADTEMVQAYIARANNNAQHVTRSVIAKPIDWIKLSADLKEDREGTLESFRDLDALAGKYVKEQGDQK